MNTLNKNQVRLKDAIAITVVIVLISIFCRLMGFSLLIPLLLLFMGGHLFLSRKINYKLFLNLGLLTAIILAGCYTVIENTEISPFYIPVASVAMLAILLFNDLQLVLIISIISSVIAGLLLGNNLSMALVFFVGSLTGGYCLRNARMRGTLFFAGISVGIMQVIAFAVQQPDAYSIITRQFAVESAWPLFLSGLISSFIIAATLKIFEILFGVVTNFSLLELSDFNQPLLKKMILEAPGTYHHSIVVSNLAEAAADAIGANALLTRVGAYYHDIGKMEKSEYYTENQLVGGNVHDNIEPSISRLVILNHVKNGIELARKYKLNPIIIDFIPQHHGTSLMYYFYQRALEEAEDESTIKEENYRYPGPKPQLRETAIVLLADSVEAATRSLGEPNPKKIEENVRKIINNKFIDGQLDECNLTLREIELIALTFTRILSAMYHGRVRYPEKKNGDNRSKKSAEETPPGSSSDQPDHKEDPQGS